MTIAEYAFVKNGEVINIAVFDSPAENLLNHFKIDQNLDLIIPATNYCRLGHIYDGEDFYPPQPFPSWTKDKTLKIWVPPVEKPKDGKEYVWDESIISWILSSSNP